MYYLVKLEYGFDLVKRERHPQYLDRQKNER